MQALDFDEWASKVTYYADEWFKLNSLEMTMEQSQVNHVQDQLAKFRLTPEQAQLTTDHLDSMRQAIFNGLYMWASGVFKEICPNCEKSRVVLDVLEEKQVWACGKQCGWTGEKYEVLRVRK